MYAVILKQINAKRAAVSPEQVRLRFGEDELASMGDESPLFKYST